MRLRGHFGLKEAIEYLEAQIRDLVTASYNVWGPDAIMNYFGWIDRASRELRDRFADDDLVEMLYTPHYWHIRDSNNEISPQKAHLIDHELRVHKARLEEALDHLRLFEPMMRYRHGSPVVLDTNVLVNFDPLSDRISYDRWLEITGIRRGAQLWVVIPHIVIDEIDWLSHSGDRKLNVKARKAMRALDPFVDELLPSSPPSVRPDEGWMTVEILPDAPGHRRQADNDMELLDRAQFIYQINGLRAVTLVTADRGMRIRGMVRQVLPAASAVNVVPMPEDLRVQDQPQRPPSKGQRQEKASTSSQPSTTPSVPPDPFISS
jgi:PIN domain